jgi:glycosyltransferase involved in cell wall biosynthesis
MNFCFIPWIDWHSYLHSRPHQLVREALRRGHRVLYLNPGMGPVLKEGSLEVWHPLSHPFFNRIKKIMRGEFLRRTPLASGKRLTPMRGWVYRPYEEGNRRTFLSKFLIEALTRQKLRVFRDRRGENIILFEQPFPFVYQLPNLKRLGYVVIYDLIDDWSAYQDSPDYFQKTEPYLLHNADIVTATAKPLHEKALRHNPNAYLCPNAADMEHFLSARREWAGREWKRPEDLPEGKQIAGFFGIMREWFDTDLMREVAQKKTAFEFCLIGGYSQDVFERLKDLKNIRFLGEKDYSLLPQYLSYFDVALIPFKTNELIRSTNPIKVYEYLAGGKPVVSTDIPEIERMPSVYASKNQEEFMKNLDVAIGVTPDLREIDAFLKDQTWAKRFDVIEKAIAELSFRPQAHKG